jgi:hypothetical protein
MDNLRGKQCVFCGSALSTISIFSRSGHLRYCEPYRQRREAEISLRDNEEFADFPCSIRLGRWRCRRSPCSRSVTTYSTARVTMCAGAVGCAHDP